MDESVSMFPFEYAMDYEALEIYCGQLLIRRIPYEDIAEVGEGFSLLAANWCNLMPFSYLTLKLNKGLIRRLVINPPEPLEFMSELSQRQHLRQNLSQRNLATA